MRQSATLSLSISLARKSTTKQILFSNTMNCIHRRRKSPSELLHLKDHLSGSGFFEVNSIRISRKDVEEPCSAPSYSIDASNCLQPWPAEQQECFAFKRALLAQLTIHEIHRKSSRFSLAPHVTRCLFFIGVLLNKIRNLPETIARSSVFDVETRLRAHIKFRGYCLNILPAKHLSLTETRASSRCTRI